MKKKCIVFSGFAVAAAILAISSYLLFRDNTPVLYIKKDVSVYHVKKDESIKLKASGKANYDLKGIGLLNFKESIRWQPRTYGVYEVYDQDNELTGKIFVD